MANNDLLVIFDQSQSMTETWGNTTKLEAAKAALVAAITPLRDRLTVGAIFLPDPKVACIIDSPQTMLAVQPIEGSGNIAFQPASQFLQSFDAHWKMSGTGMGVGTPLNEAFDRADEALQAAMGSSALGGRMAVLVFTDGQPNCTPDPRVTGIATEPEPKRAADWLRQGIKTYVVGLPGAAGVQLLNDIAAKGGTTMYLTPDDPAALTLKLTQVVQQVSSLSWCSIDLVSVSNEPSSH